MRVQARGKRIEKVCVEGGGVLNKIKICFKETFSFDAIGDDCENFVREKCLKSSCFRIYNV